jgi:hypothetical protein
MEMATYVLLSCLLNAHLGGRVRVERGGDEIDVRIEGSDEFDLSVLDPDTIWDSATI